MSVENVDISVFIDLIEKYSFLWDKKEAKFKDKIATENAWSSIATIMEISVKEAQELWDYLKRKFIRERRVKKNVPSGSGADYSSTWELYDRLGFLNRVLQTRRTKGNIIKNIKKSGEEWEELTVGDDGVLLSPESSVYEMEDSVTEEGEGMSQGMSSARSSTSEKIEVMAEEAATTASARASTLRKEKNVAKKKTDEPLQELIGTCSSIGRNVQQMFEKENTEEKDEDYLFVMSLLPSLKKIPYKRKLQFKAKILLQIAENVNNSDDDE